MINHNAAEFDSFKRMNVFGQTNAGDYTSAPSTPVKTKAVAAFAGLKGVVDKLTAATAGQTSGEADFHAGTGSKASHRGALLDELRGMVKSAESIATEQKKPEMMESFRMPHGNNDTVLASTARAFADAADKSKAAFVELGHDANFTDALRSHVKDFETADDDQAKGLEKRGGSTANIHALVTQGQTYRKQLEAIMGNILKGDAEKTGAWNIASHVEPNSTSTATQPAPDKPKP